MKYRTKQQTIEAYGGTMIEEAHASTMRSKLQEKAPLLSRHTGSQKLHK